MTELQQEDLGPARRHKGRAQKWANRGVLEEKLLRAIDDSVQRVESGEPREWRRLSKTSPRKRLRNCSSESNSSRWRSRWGRCSPPRRETSRREKRTSEREERLRGEGQRLVESTLSEHCKTRAQQWKTHQPELQEKYQEAVEAAACLFVLPLKTSDVWMRKLKQIPLFNSSTPIRRRRGKGSGAEF